MNRQNTIANQGIHQTQHSGAVTSRGRAEDPMNGSTNGFMVEVYKLYVSLRTHCHVCNKDRPFTKTLNLLYGREENRRLVC